MDWTLYQSVPPALEPLTVSEVKTHLRLDAANTEPAPGSCTAALGSVAGNLSAGAYRYKVTFVTADGETEAGTASSAVTVANPAVAGKISVSAIPVGSSAVTSRKLYRTAAGGSTYLLCATIADNATTVYTDNIADASLGAGAPSANSTGDPYLTALIKAARKYAEERTRRQLISATWVYGVDRFPVSGVIELPRPPLASVTSVTYVDDDGATQTLVAPGGEETAEYEVDANQYVGSVRVPYEGSWPAARLHHNSMQVTYVAGYGASPSDVPETIRRAMLMLVAHWYENRQSVITGMTATSIPFAADMLLDIEGMPQDFIP